MGSWSIVFAIGAAQAALLAVALWRRPVNAEANRVLAVWIALIGIDLAVKAIYFDAPAPGLLKAFRFVGLFPFLYGSLFYVYVRALTEARAFGWRDAVHLIGFAAVVCLHASFFMQDRVQTEAFFTRLMAGTAEPQSPRLDVPLYAYSLSYVIAGLVRVRRYRRELLQRRSDVDRMSLRWIDAMAVSQIVIWCIATTQWLVKIPWVDYLLIYGAVSAWVFVVGYLSLSQVAVVIEAAPEPTPIDIIHAPGSDDPRFPEVEARLSQLMAQQQLYREPALTIGQLAKRSGYPEYLVSAVINRRFEGNFWEYINRQRIEAARACLADAGDARTILDIAYACGFTSKSTFNAAFKRQLDETPSAYRKRHVRDGASTSANA
ncbi:MAG TPA: AraC family transcriptional regulator [Stenotrophomonas sp.]|jgi:AraC-like DNA-binding protein